MANVEIVYVLLGGRENDPDLEGQQIYGIFKTELSAQRQKEVEIRAYSTPEGCDIDFVILPHILE